MAVGGQWSAPQDGEGEGGVGTRHEPTVSYLEWKYGLVWPQLCVSDRCDIMRHSL